MNKEVFEIRLKIPGEEYSKQALCVILSLVWLFCMCS